MGSLSNYICDIVLDHIFGNTVYTPPATVYLALSSADPLDDGTGCTEPTGGAYDRKPINFAAAASRTILTSVEIPFEQATANWGLMSHYAIFDQLTGGNMLAFGLFIEPPNVELYKTLYIPMAEIGVSLDSGGVSDYLAHKILDLVFSATSYTPPDIYLALNDVDVLDSDTGTSIHEIVMLNYARQLNASWTAASSGSLTSNALVDFGQLSGTSEVLESVCSVDAAVDGNLLFYDNAPSVTIDTNDLVEIEAGSYSISLV